MLSRVTGVPFDVLMADSQAASAARLEMLKRIQDRAAAQERIMRDRVQKRTRLQQFLRG